MRQAIFVAATITISTVFLVTEGVRASDADEARQWRAEYTDSVRAGKPFELHNLQRRALFLTSQFGYRKRIIRFGSDQDDVGWTARDGGGFMFVRTNPRDHRTIGEHEVVALFNTSSKKYLVGKWVWRGNKPPRQPWSSSPSYEWMVHKREGANFALYNIHARDYLVLGGTHNGANESLTYLYCSTVHKAGACILGAWFPH